MKLIKTQGIKLRAAGYFFNFSLTLLVWPFATTHLFCKNSSPLQAMVSTWEAGEQIIKNNSLFSILKST